LKGALTKRMPDYNFSKYQSKFKKFDNTRMNGNEIEKTQKRTKKNLTNLDTSYVIGAINTEFTWEAKTSSFDSSEISKYFLRVGVSSMTTSRIRA
jgi:hypothetical protein